MKISFHHKVYTGLKLSLVLAGAVFCFATMSHRACARTLTVSQYGALGDGEADDTAALQKALDALLPGDELKFEGKTYRHTNVLTLNKASVRLSGPGTLLATDEQRSNFFIDADTVTVDGGLIFKMASTTQRWGEYEKMKIRLGRRSGIVLRDITVDGSAAAGIYVGGSRNFTLADVTVKNTRADGIHCTEGAKDGTILRPIIRNVGDDGVAVVSYQNNNEPVCTNITIESPRFYGSTWGRAFSVVGGSHITYRDIYAENSKAAALYIACEPSYNTHDSRNIRVLGGTIKNANTSAEVDHGAVLIYNGRNGTYLNSDIEISGLCILETRVSASRQVGVLGEARRVQLKDFVIVGGPANLLTVQNASTTYNTSGWQHWTNKTTPPDHSGFTP